MRKTFILLFIAASSLVISCSEKEDIVTIHTDFGDIVLLLFNETPKHKANFIKLTKEGAYDSTTFHRVMEGFMIQGGDPNSKDDDINNDGIGGPGYTVPEEFNPNLTHIKGALAAARQPDQVNPEKASSGSQFYIVEPDDGYHPLDGNYTVFGQTISGFDVVSKIAGQPKNGRNRPFEDIKMTVEVKSMTRKKIAKEYGYAFE
jgi:cyclophilin family peptidyl-prolyl cis-trans isomerase